MSVFKGRWALGGATEEDERSNLRGEASPDTGAPTAGSSSWSNFVPRWIGGGGAGQGDQADPPADTEVDLSSADNGAVPFFGEISWTMRIQLFIACQFLAFLTNTVSWLALSAGRYNRSVALTTIANMMAILGTTFLMGLRRQCASMFDPVRRTASIIYLSTMALTIFVAVTIGSLPLCVMLSIAQYMALVWYSLSYVPYGRTMARNAASGLVKVVVSV